MIAKLRLFDVPLNVTTAVNVIELANRVCENLCTKHCTEPCELKFETLSAYRTALFPFSEIISELFSSM